MLVIFYEFYSNRMEQTYRDIKITQEQMQINLVDILKKSDICKKHNTIEKKQFCI